MAHSGTVPRSVVAGPSSPVTGVTEVTDVTRTLVIVLGGAIMGGTLAMAVAAIFRARIKREPLPTRARVYVGLVFVAVLVWLAVFAVLPIIRLFS